MALIDNVIVAFIVDIVLLHRPVVHSIRVWRHDIGSGASRACTPERVDFKFREVFGGDIAQLAALHDLALLALARRRP